MYELSNLRFIKVTVNNVEANSSQTLLRGTVKLINSSYECYILQSSLWCNNIAAYELWLNIMLRLKWYLRNVKYDIAIIYSFVFMHHFWSI